MHADYALSELLPIGVATQNFGVAAQIVGVAAQIVRVAVPTPNQNLLPLNSIRASR
jgi:hypothetical protein